MHRRIFLFLLLLLPCLWLTGACSDNDRAVAPSTSALTATVASVRGQVLINFAGAPQQRASASQPFAVESGANAWTAIQNAIGGQNLTFQDFGGSLGIFITGFYGVRAEGSAFWEFFVNGVSSNIGVSSYNVKDGDVLEFRYSK